MKKILKIDIDGVLRNITPEVLHIYNTKMNKSDHIYTVQDITNFEYHKCLPDFNMNYEDFFTKYSNIFRIAKPYKLAIEGLRKLSREYEIVLVSAQYNGNDDITDNWLKEWKATYDRVVYTFDKNEVDGWVLLDDSLDNLKVTNSIPVCMSRHWNKSYSGYTIDNMFDFNGILSYIDK